MQRPADESATRFLPAAVDEQHQLVGVHLEGPGEPAEGVDIRCVVGLPDQATDGRVGQTGSNKVNLLAHVEVAHPLQNEPAQTGGLAIVSHGKEIYLSPRLSG